MSTNVNNPNPTGDVQELYAVSEGKKHGATREVRPESAWDKYYTVLKVSGGDAVLNDNWHTNEVFGHVRNNFEGITFAQRTLEAWGAVVQSERLAYYIAGGRVWVLDLEPSAGKKPRIPGNYASK